MHFLVLFFCLVAEKLEVEYMKCLGPLGLKARLSFLSHSLDLTTDRED